MSTLQMPGVTWRTLVKAKKKRALFRIHLIVRGKPVTKEYTNEREYEKWLETYNSFVDNGHGIEKVETEVVYQ